MSNPQRKMIFTINLYNKKFDNPSVVDQLHGVIIKNL